MGITPDSVIDSIDTLIGIRQLDVVREERIRDMAFDGERLRIRSIRFGRQSGSSRRFLFLHGNPATADDFEQLAPLVAELGEVMAPDLPGFGATSTLKGRATPSGLSASADVCRALLAEAGWNEGVTVVGHSHGGGVAQVLAGRYPECVSSLVLVGTLGHAAHLSYRTLSRPAVARLFSASADVLARPGFGWAKRGVARSVGAWGFWPDGAPDDWLGRFEDFLAEEGSVAWMAALAAAAPCDELVANTEAIRCPVLMLHGSSDCVVPLEYAQALRAALTAAGVRSEFEVIQRAGHMLPQRNAPELAGHIRRWCNAHR